MKKLLLTLTLFQVTLSGCAAFVEGFNEGWEEQAAKNKARNKYRNMSINEIWRAEDKTRRDAAIEQHPEWSDIVKQDVSRGIVRIGWDKVKVEASMGWPMDINRTTGSWGVHEQWVFGKLGHIFSYVYFENGVVTAIQN